MNGGQKRRGFTTGSCAAAAAKAAALALFFDETPKEVEITTPAGEVFKARPVGLWRGEGAAGCAVVKDGGDDPDVTTGAHITAVVSLEKDAPTDGLRIEIRGGKGVGTVTLPGLDQPVGAAAINRVPRAMIEREVEGVCRMANHRGTLSVEISVPEGEELAQKTFNPRLGIVGGISIIGTSGIVEPMSSRALLDAVEAELRQRRALGYDYAAIAPGNYGRDFLARVFGFDLDRTVKCGNFIRETVSRAARLGFHGLLLVGHAGKLCKTACGVGDTHSAQGDGRMESLASAAAMLGAPASLQRALLGCATTEEACVLLQKEGLLESVMEELAQRCRVHLNRWSGQKMRAECILYVNECGTWAESKGANEWLTLLARERERSI